MGQLQKERKQEEARKGSMAGLEREKRATIACEGHGEDWRTSTLVRFVRSDRLKEGRR